MFSVFQLKSASFDIEISQRYTVSSLCLKLEQLSLLVQSLQCCEHVRESHSSRGRGWFSVGFVSWISENSLDLQAR